MNKIYTTCIALCLYVSSHAQWTSQTIPNFRTSDVDIVDNSTSFIIGNQGDSGGSTLYRLGNGANLSVVKVASTALYKGCHFFDAQNGLICGLSEGKELVWRTTDGGLTLNPIQVSTTELTYPTDFTFVSNSIGYLFATSPFSGSKIYKTTNGGLAWQIVKKEEEVFIYDMRFLTGALGHRLTYQGLETSRDSAKTWQNISSPIGLRSLFFQTEQIGYVGNNEGEIFKTTNGGVSWSLIMKIPNGIVTNIKFPTSSIGYATISSDFDYVMRTTDGGVTWKMVYQSASEAQIFEKIDFLNENTLAVVGVGFAYANSGVNSNDAKKSTLLLSGKDTSCSASMKLRFDLTGNAPWEIVLKDNKGVTKNLTATKTPYDIPFTPTELPASEYSLIPESVKGAGENSSNVVGGKRNIIRSFSCGQIFCNPFVIF